MARDQQLSGRARSAGDQHLSGRARSACLLAYAAVTFLSFPHPLPGPFSSAGVIDLGLVMAWWGPALLMLACDGLTPWRALGLGFAAGLLGQSAILHWIYVVTVTYGHAPAAIGVLAPIAVAAYTALFIAAFGFGFVWLRRFGFGGPFSSALLWTCLDHGRSFFLSGWPWATLGYSQHENPALCGLASLTGVYGLSFTVALGAGALAEGLRALRAVGERRRAPARMAGLAALGVVALHVLGWVAAPSPAVPGAATIRVAALQGNIDQGQKWSPDLLGRTFSIYEDLAREAAADGAQLIVWPETALPVAIDLTPGMRERLQVLARETNAAHVVGAVGVAVDRVGRIEAYFDSAFLLASDGNLLDRYDKSHLVPFGEYVPLRGLLGRFVHAIARGIADSDVTPGPAPRAIDVPLRTWDGGERQVQVGVPICYELLFPDLVRRFVRDGAGVLLAITNDAWYGRTGAPYQFLAMTALRSAETGVWTVRAANTGVSAFIDGSGRVVEETKIFERDWIVADVPLRPPETSQTFYVRYGDVFAVTCWVALLVVTAIGVRRNKHEKRRNEHEERQARV